MFSSGQRLFFLKQCLCEWDYFDNKGEKTHAHSASRPQSQLTSFDADVGAADLAGLVLGRAEVVVVVDVAVVGGGREGVQLQGSIGVHVSDVGHVVDVVAGGQVPAQYGTGGAACWTGQGHPHRAGVGNPLQGGIHKVQPGGAHILTVYCGGKQTAEHNSITGQGEGERHVLYTHIYIHQQTGFTIEAIGITLMDNKIDRVGCPSNVLQNNHNKCMSNVQLQTSVM